MDNRSFHSLMKYRNTITRLSTLISRDKRKDVTFVFEGSNKKILAHKCILEAVSPVFDAMFNGFFSEDHEVIINDIKPNVFQLMINGIYLKEVKFNEEKDEDVENAADLYYAAEKYDIIDLKNIAKDFMISAVHGENLSFLLAKAEIFNLPNLSYACYEYFRRNTYLVLRYHLDYQVTDDLMSVFFKLDELSILHEFEIYVALEVMVKKQSLKTYSNCLRAIRFLTMTTSEVTSCALLSDPEIKAIGANIEASQKLYYLGPALPMPWYWHGIPPHLSSSTEKRTRMKINQRARQKFWISVVLFSPNYEEYFNHFVKFMNVPGHHIQLTEAFIKTARDALTIAGTNKWEVVRNTTDSIFNNYSV